MPQMINLRTDGRGFYELTDQVTELVTETDMENGLCHCHILHTSASLVVTENADPAVLRDLERFISDLAPDSTHQYEHSAEGPDDMPAHIRSVLTQTSVSLPVVSGELLLGTWQGLYLWEHRSRPHQRKVLLQLISEG